MPLFVVLRAGAELDDDLRERDRARACASTLAAPRARRDRRRSREVPRTLTGKKLEVPVKKILHGRRPGAGGQPRLAGQPGRARLLHRSWHGLRSLTPPRSRSGPERGVEPLHQLAAEPECALEGGLLHPARRVASPGGGRGRSRARCGNDRDRGIAAERGGVAVALRSRFTNGLRAAPPRASSAISRRVHELDVRPGGEQGALAPGVADGAGADLVEVDEDGAPLVEPALVSAQEAAHPVGQSLLGAGEEIQRSKCSSRPPWRRPARARPQPRRRCPWRRATSGTERCPRVAARPRSAPPWARTGPPSGACSPARGSGRGSRRSTSSCARRTARRGRSGA